MYGSLKSWLNVPAHRMPYESITGAGTKVYGETTDFLCYPTGKVKTVTNSDGIDVVSNNQLFVDGLEVFNELDAVVFEGVERSLKAINTFYRNGVPDLKVLFL